MTLSVVIPAYNEEPRLPSSPDRITRCLSHERLEAWEVIVVDDGSNDSTPSFVEQYSRREPGVRLLRNPRNRGKGYAVRHGMLTARREWILFSDADLSTSIEEVTKLLSIAVEEQCAIVIGCGR